MVTKKITVLTIGLAAIVAVGVLATIMPSQGAFADTLCKGNLHAQQSVVLVETAAKAAEVVIPAMLLLETLVLVAHVLQ